MPKRRIRTRHTIHVIKKQSEILGQENPKHINQVIRHKQNKREEDTASKPARLSYVKIRKYMHLCTYIKCTKLLAHFSSSCILNLLPSNNLRKRERERKIKWQVHDVYVCVCVKQATKNYIDASLISPTAAAAALERGEEHLCLDVHPSTPEECPPLLAANISSSSSLLKTQQPASQPAPTLSLSPLNWL